MGHSNFQHGGASRPTWLPCLKARIKEVCIKILTKLQYTLNELAKCFMFSFYSLFYNQHQYAIWLAVLWWKISAPRSGGDFYLDLGRKIIHIVKLAIPTVRIRVPGPHLSPLSLQPPHALLSPLNI